MHEQDIGSTSLHVSHVPGGREISCWRGGAPCLRRPASTGPFQSCWGSPDSSGPGFVWWHLRARSTDCTLHASWAVAPNRSGFQSRARPRLERTPAWQRRQKELLQHLAFSFWSFWLSVLSCERRRARSRYRLATIGLGKDS